MLRSRWISLLLIGLITSSLVEPVIGSACAEQAHPGAHTVADASQASSSLVDVHNGRPVEHPGHGSSADHCMHQHGTLFGSVPARLAVTVVDVDVSADAITSTPPRIVLPPPFHPPRA